MRRDFHRCRRRMAFGLGLPDTSFQQCLRRSVVAAHAQSGSPRGRVARRHRIQVADQRRPSSRKLCARKLAAGSPRSLRRRSALIDCPGAQGLIELTLSPCSAAWDMASSIETEFRRPLTVHNRDRPYHPLVMKPPSNGHLVVDKPAFAALASRRNRFVCRMPSCALVLCPRLEVVAGKRTPTSKRYRRSGSLLRIGITELVAIRRHGSTIKE